MSKYIHLNYVLRYIREEEKVEFKIIDSEDYGITDESSFKILIPKDFDVDDITLKENLEDINLDLYEIHVYNKEKLDAIDGPYVLLWKGELFSTKDEKSVCILDSDIDEGFLIFNNFTNIPYIVGSKDILKYIN